MARRRGNKLINFSAAAVALALLIALLVYAENLLVPFAIALIVWYLLTAVVQGFASIPFGSWRMPGWLALSAAGLSGVAIIAFVVEMISANIAQVIQAAPGYQANLEKLSPSLLHVFGIDKIPTFAQLGELVNVGQLVTSVATTLTGIAGDAGIIAVYVLFLLIEQRYFDSKLRALFPDTAQEKRVRDILHRIQRDIQTYVWIKTLVSLMTGGASYIVLRLVGVEFAEFWAFIIFLLNYIPTIGSLIGIVFPALLALMQFGEFEPFLILLVVLGAINFFIGNVIEPRMMGRSLNLSPLVVILSLAVWATLWGIVGAFLCVPLTVIAMIICGQFPLTRPVAVMLSKDGKVE